MPGQLKLAVARLLLAFATIALARPLLPVAEEPSRAALTAVIYACAALIVVLLFRLPADAPGWRTLRWCLTVTLVLGVVLIADPLTRPVIVVSPAMVTTFFLTAATIAVLVQRLPATMALAVVALLMLCPLWAAPALELAGNPAVLTDAVVASSPMTVFAVAADLDYLRTGWFYAHSALGSMRYAYPSLTASCLVLSLVPMATVLIGLVRSVDFTSLRTAKEAHS